MTTSTNMSGQVNPAGLPTPMKLLAGPQLLGVFFNWGLLGALTLQYYSYCDNFPHDPRVLKCLVLGVFVYEWVQTGLITAAAMQIYVYDYGNVLSMLAFHNTWFSATIMCGLISAVVQIFFAWRIIKLSRSRTNGRAMAVFVTLLALIQMIACFLTGAKEKVEVIARALDGELLTVAIIWLAGTVVVDVAIAVCMTYLLLRSKTGIAPTDALINRMVRLVVETGTLTASLSILVLVTANVHPLHQTLVYQAPALILTKMYSNTFLTNLNSRINMRRHDELTVDLPPMSMRFANDRSTSTGYTSSVENSTDTDAQQKNISLVGALEGTLSRNSESTLQQKHAEVEDNNAVSRRSEKHKQRRYSIV